MGILEKSTIYLSGAVESHSDPYSWRDFISPQLESMGAKVWNPLIKPSWMTNIKPEEQSDWKKQLNSKRETPWEVIKQGNRITREFCLGLARQCNIMIVKIDKSFTVGTWEELNVAVQCHKPIYVICEDPVPSMWLLDQLGEYENYEEVFFRNETELLIHLRKIDCGGIQIDGIKWIFATYNM